MSNYQPRTGSSCDKALNAIREHGKRISEEAMSVLLDCDLNEVSALLNYPIKLGILKKVRDEGLTWYDVGDGVPLPTSTVAPPPVQPAVKPITRRVPARSSQAVEAVESEIDASREVPTGVITDAPIAAHPFVTKADVNLVLKSGPETVEHFACALYSDGRFVIEFGEQRMTLPEKHTIKLVNYVDRLSTEDS